jgi:hypothetical protein
MPSFDDEDDEIGGESSSNNKRSASLGHRKKKNVIDVGMKFADEDGASDYVPRSNGHAQRWQGTQRLADEESQPWFEGYVIFFRGCN